MSIKVHNSIIVYVYKIITKITLIDIKVNILIAYIKKVFFYIISWHFRIAKRLNKTIILDIG